MRLWINCILTLYVVSFSASSISKIVSLPVSIPFSVAHLSFGEVYYSSDSSRENLTSQADEIFKSMGWEKVSFTQSSGVERVVRKEPYDLQSDLISERLPYLRLRDQRGDKKVIKRWKRTNRWKDWSGVSYLYDKASAGRGAVCTRYLSAEISAFVNQHSTSFKNSIQVCFSDNGPGSKVYIEPQTYHFIDQRYQLASGSIGILWLPWIDGVSLAADVREFNVQLSEKFQNFGSQIKEKSPEILVKKSSGTGFFINNYFLVTNQHVVDQCDEIIVVGHGRGSIFAADKSNDIALIVVAQSSLHHLDFAQTPIELGQDISVLGYPLQGVLAKTINLTKGSISSMAGLFGDTKMFQMTAAIQPGNSGGPVVNDSGRIIGIATSTLNPKFAMRHLDTLPQGVNFAIRNSIVTSFLNIYGAKIGTESERIVDIKYMEKAVKPVECLTNK